MNAKLSIKWTLHRFLKEGWIGMDGIMFSPVDAFSTSLTSDFFRDAMNSSNCFDFDYCPGEDDNIIFKLIIYDKISHRSFSEEKFISLIFRNGVWVIDYYDLFYNTIEEIGKGFLKFID